VGLIPFFWYENVPPLPFSFSWWEVSLSFFPERILCEYRELPPFPPFSPPPWDPEFFPPGTCGLRGYPPLVTEVRLTNPSPAKNRFPTRRVGKLFFFFQRLWLVSFFFFFISLFGNWVSQPVFFFPPIRLYDKDIFFFFLSEGESKRAPLLRVPPFFFCSMQGRFTLPPLPFAAGPPLSQTPW